jgi:hypothetical protein
MVKRRVAAFGLGLGRGFWKSAASLTSAAVVAASFAVLGLVSAARGAEGVVPQFGNASTPTAMIWSPDGKWIAAATETDVVLWDAATGAVLRALRNPRRAREFALVESGAVVAVRDGAGRGWAWRAETGEPLNVGAAFAAADWRNVSARGNPFLLGKKALKYLEDIRVRPLFKGPLLEGKADVLEVRKVNEKNVVLVSYARNGEDAQHAYVDTARKEVLATFGSDKAWLNCGSPSVAFARRGDRIAVAPTERDASISFLNAAVVEVGKSPPKVVWTHFCRDFLPSGIRMERGRILACATPDDCVAWDPDTARIVARPDQVLDSPSVGMTTSPDGKYRRIDEERRGGTSTVGRRRRNAVDEPVHHIVEAATGRKILTLRTDFYFSEDSRHAWVAEDWQSMSVSYWSLETGRRLWTATELTEPVGVNRPVKHRLVVEYPDGKVRLSQGAERFVRVVDGFKSRPFTRADAGKFLEK